MLRRVLITAGLMLILAGCGSTRSNKYSARQVIAAASVISAGCNPARLAPTDEWATLAEKIIPGYRAKTKNGTAAICIATTGDTAEMTVITSHDDKITDSFYQFTRVDGHWTQQS